MSSIPSEIGTFRMAFRCRGSKLNLRSSELSSFSMCLLFFNFGGAYSSCSPVSLKFNPFAVKVRIVQIWWSFSRLCPVYKKEKEITTIKTKQKISFPQARRLWTALHPVMERGSFAAQFAKFPTAAKARGCAGTCRNVRQNCQYRWTCQCQTRKAHPKGRNRTLKTRTCLWTIQTKKWRNRQAPSLLHTPNKTEKVATPVLWTITKSNFNKTFLFKHKEFTILEFPTNIFTSYLRIKVSSENKLNTLSY